MSAELTTKAASHLLRRLHTLLILGKRSNTLALAIRRALEEIRQWPQSLPFSAHFEKRPPRLVFAGYGPKFIKMIQEMMDHGSIAMLDTLQADYSPFFCELCELPGIGETVARRMFYDRMIESFEDLRVAFANHVLDSITGFGGTRVRIIEAWILAKTDDPDVAACDIVVSDPSKPSQPALSSSNLSPSPKNDLSEPELSEDYSEEDVFGNELDAALMDDLAALPSLSFENAKKACGNTPTTVEPLDTPVTPDVVFPRDQERLQSVSYLKASHVSQIDLQFSQTDTRKAHHTSTITPDPGRAFADWAMTRCMPPAFMARYIAMARLDSVPANDDILMIGNRMPGLIPAITSQLRDYGIKCPVVVSTVCPEQGLYARIFIDPLHCLDMASDQVKTVLSRLSMGGIVVAAAPVFSQIGIPNIDEPISQFQAAASASEGITFHTESVDFMTICRINRPKKSFG